MVTGPKAAKGGKVKAGKAKAGKGGKAQRGRPVVRIGLDEARAKRALSLSDLAEVSGVDRQTIHRIEQGQQVPFPVTRRKLAAALQVDVDSIAWGE